MRDSSNKQGNTVRSRGVWASALLALALLASAVLPPVQIFAESSEIQSFEAQDPAYTETVLLGTPAEEIQFPETLEATLKDGSKKPVPVTWTSADYDADKAGAYTFAAQFDGYTYALARPYAVITVDETAVKPRKQPGAGDQAGADALTALIIEVIDRLPGVDAVKGLDKSSAELKRVCADVDLIASLMADLSAAGLADLEQAVGAERLAKLNGIFEYLMAQTDALKPKDAGPPIGNDAYISNFSIGITDGTAVWGSTQKPGSDVGPKNRIVRTYDTVIYSLATSTALYAGKQPYEGERVKYEMILPYTKDELEPDESLLGWTDKSAGYAYQITQENRLVNGVMKPCQVVTAYKLLEIAEGVPFAVPGQCTVAFGVRVKAMANGAAVQPIFTAKLEHNTEANELRTKTADQVSVSAKLNLNVSLESYSKQVGAEQPDFSTGNAQALDKGTPKQKGQLFARGLAVRMMSPDGDGVKGCEVPVGTIQFKLRSDVRLNGSDVSSNPGYYRRVWSWGPNDPAAVGPDGRAQNLLSGGKYPYSQMVPFNTGAGIDSCYNGGGWSVTRVDAKTLAVSIQNFQVDFDRFPQRTAGLTKQDSALKETYGIISAGELHSWQPLAAYYSAPFDVFTYKTLISHLRVTDLDAVGQFGSVQKDSAGTHNQQPVSTDKQDTFEITMYKHPPGSAIQYQYTVMVPEHWRLGDTLLDTNGDPIPPMFVTGGTGGTQGASKLRIGQEFQIYSINAHGGVNQKYSYRFIFFDPRVMEPTGVNKFNDDRSDLIDRSVYYLTHDGIDFDVSDQNYFLQQLGRNRDVYKSLSAIPSSKYCCGVLIVSSYAKSQGYDQALIGMRVKPSAVKYLKRGVHVTSTTVCTSDAQQHARNVNKLNAAPYGYVDLEKEWSWNARYIPAAYGPDGTVASAPNTQVISYPPGPPKHYQLRNIAGDSAFLTGFSSQIYKEVAQVQNGQPKISYLQDFNETEVDYSLEPAILGAAGVPASVKETVTVTDTLPKELRYKPGSAYYGGTYAMSAQGGGHQGTVSGGVSKEPAVVNNADGTQTLTWTFPGQPVAQTMEKIHYTATIVGGKPNAVVNAVNTATIKLSSDTGAPKPSQKSQLSISIVSLAAESFGKFPEAPSVTKGESVFKYHLFNSNTFPSPLADATLIDTLPYKGDAVGSDFDGTLKVHSFKVNPTYLDLSKMKLYYTTNTAYKGKTSADLTLSQIKSNWTQGTIQPDGTSTDMNGKSVVCWALIGELGVKKSMVVDLELEQEIAKSKAGDKYVNRASTFGGDPIPSSVRVVSYSISGCTWLDANKDGIQDPGENKFDGLTATLMQLTPGGDPANESDYTVYSPVIGGTPTPMTVAVGKQRNTSTGAESAYQPGEYKFTEVPMGVYAVKITDGTAVKLMHYTASPVNQGSDDTKDSDAAGTLANGLLAHGFIKNIVTPPLNDSDPNPYEIAHNDAGFYREDKLFFKKLSPQGQILPGAGFTLYEAQPSGTGYTWNSGSPVKPEVMSNAAGLVIFTGVQPNKKYILAETTAPSSDYRVSTPNDYILADVAADGSYTLTGYGFFSDAGMITQTNGLYEVKNAYAEAKIKIKKVISNYAAYGTQLKDHAFTVNLSGDMTASAVLKHGETSGTITHLVDGSSDTVDVSEIVPMEYSAGYTVSSAIRHADGTQETKPGRQLTLLPGDEVTVTVTNTFEHKGFFKDRGFVNNQFDAGP